MPYKIVKTTGGFLVEGPRGKNYSKHPLAKEMAIRQREAIALSESARSKKPASFYFVK